MNENRPTAAGTAHEIALKDRNRMSITGVKEVLSFDESAVELQTACGELTVEGAGLRIGVLDTERGLVTLEGSSIDALLYPRAERDERRGLFGKWRK